MKKILIFIVLVIAFILLTPFNKSIVEVSNYILNDRSERGYLPSFSKSRKSNIKQFVFGIYPGHNPQRLFEVFNPLIKYLSDNIKDTNFVLEASRNYAAFDKKLAALKFDFVLANPFQTMNAIDNGYKVFGKAGRDEEFRGIIIVRKDSPIKTPSDLYKKIVSYPAPTALAGTMMPQYYLQKNGVEVMRDLDNRYVGSQVSSIMNAYLKQSAAAAAWPPPWRELCRLKPNITKDLKVLWKTKPLIPNGLLALKKIPDSITAQVLELMQNPKKYMHRNDFLWCIEFSNVVSTASNKSYGIVRDFMKKYNKEVRKSQ